MRILIAMMIFSCTFTCGITNAKSDHPVPEKEIDELSSILKEIYRARTTYDRSTAKEMEFQLEQKIAEIEQDHDLDTLLRHTDLWHKIREGAINAEDRIFRKTGWGFQENVFIDHTEVPPRQYSYFISLPDGYDAEGDKRFPVILFLHPEIKGNYRKLESEVSDLLEAYYSNGDFLKKYVIIAPVGPVEEQGRREETLDAGKNWESLEIGRKTAFIGIRLLLEQMVFDRSRVFVSGMENAGLSAFRYASWYPSLFTGVIGRDAPLGPIAIENTEGIPFLYVSSADNDEERRLKALQWKENETNDGLDAKSKITLIDDTGKRMKSSREASKAVMEWMAGIEKETVPKEVFLKAVDLAMAGAYWLRINELNVGLNTRLTDPDTAWVKGRVDPDSNSIFLESAHVRKVTIFLNDKLIDLDRKVNVFVDGSAMFSGRVERELSKMLDLMYYNMAGDFEVYCNFIELTLED